MEKFLRGKCSMRDQQPGTPICGRRSAGSTRQVRRLTAGAGSPGFPDATWSSRYLLTVGRDSVGWYRCDRLGPAELGAAQGRVEYSEQERADDADQPAAHHRERRRYELGDHARLDVADRRSRGDLSQVQARGPAAKRIRGIELQQ